MKYASFLNSISSKEKLGYLIGAFVSRMLHIMNFDSLRNYRILLDKIESLGFEILTSKNGNGILVIRRENVEIELRKYSSDIKAFQQVFIGREYEPVIDLILKNGIKMRTIIDAGCNIGLTSILLIQKFPNAHIICIEPDGQNYIQMSKNLKNFSLNVSLLNNALWYRQETLFLNNDFRDGEDWSRSVSTVQKKSKLPIEGIPLEYLIARYDIESIDFLKMDIEGSEAEVFRLGRDLSFLAKTKIIALEIHDELNCRQVISDILITNGFFVFNAGELTIGINRSLISK